MKILSFPNVLLASLILSSCASPNIGREVKYNQAFCKKAFGECSGKVGDFLITYSIYKDGDEYEVKGEAIHPKGRTMSWETFSGATFTIYLIKNSKIVEEIPVAGGNGGLDSKITFQRKFESNGFDYSIIGYSMKVRG